MRVLAEFGVFTLVVATVMQYSLAAPVTEFFGPPQTIEGEGNVPEKKVEEMERFHRTYENGTVEFKTALSNGHVQYQKISKKSVDGENIQVYEGYISEPYEDGRYGTRYYVADENGYRSSPVIVEDKPPKLPTNGPYSSVSNSQGKDNEVLEEGDQTKSKIENENTQELKKNIEEEIMKRLNSQNLVPTIESDKPPKLPTNGPYSSVSNSQDQDNEVVEGNDQTKSKIENENTLELKKNIEEEIMKRLNSQNLIPTIESDILKHIKEEEHNILENEINEDPTFLQNSDLPLSTEASLYLISENNSDSTPTTEAEIEKQTKEAVLENEINQDLPSSTEGSLDLVSDKVSTTEPQSDGKILDNKISEDSSIQQDSDQSSSTDASLNLNTENSFVSTSTTQGFSQSFDLSTSTDTSLVPNSEIGHEDTTEVQEITTQLPIEEYSSTEIELDSSTEQPLRDVASIENELEESKELPKIEEGFSGRSLPVPTTLSPLTEGFEDVKEHHDEINVPIQEFVPGLESSTEVPTDEFREVTTEGVSGEEERVTELTLNIEDQEQKTEIPELQEEKVEDVNTVLPIEEVSEATTDIPLSDDTLTEKPDHKIHSDVVEIDEVKIDDETSKVSTNSPEIAPKEENLVKSFLENIEENLTTQQPSSLNEEITTILPLEEVLKEVQEEESLNSEKTSKSLDIAAELPTTESNSTLTVEGSGSNESEHTENHDDQNEDSTTEADIISTTGLINDGDVTEIDSQTTTDLPLEIATEKSSETSSAQNPTEEPVVEMYHPVFRS